MAEKAFLGMLITPTPRNRHQPAKWSSSVQAMGFLFTRLCKVIADRLARDFRYRQYSAAIRRDIDREPEIGQDGGLTEIIT